PRCLGARPRRLAEKRPVLDARNGWRRSRLGRQRPPLARREPHVLGGGLRRLRFHLRHLWTRGTAFFPLGLSRAFRLLLGRALILLAPPVSAVHGRTSHQDLPFR